MCGIGGFSLSGKSKLNSRRVANVMLTSLERRGNQASGAAWHSNSSMGYLKSPVAGSRLSLKPMPRKTDAVILHTRLATHGSINDARNNHPVLSPSQNIRLVHNGVIYNHDQVRKEIDANLPPVDSSVIPAILESMSLEGIAKLDGDASIAWLSNDDYGTLRIARISHSPLVIAQVKDGSFFFASTPDILHEVLGTLDLKITFELVMPERTGYSIRSGRIVETLSIPTLDPAYEHSWGYAPRSKNKYRHMTAGNASSYSLHSDNWWDDSDDYPTPATGTDKMDWQYDFDIFLSQFIEMNDGEFFDFDGYYVGDRHRMAEMFEQERYDQWWTNA
jgi:glucosamine 6-phosphate synthetase-like amidotransferase/phosphosugar isomerase protein